MALTKQDIFNAAEELASKGQNVTVAAVRNILGGGSFTTINEAMKEWRSVQTKPEALIRENAPEAIRDRLEGLGNDIWAIATEIANNRLQSEREAMETARKELEQQQKETVEVADQMALEIEQLRNEIENKNSEIEILNVNLNGIEQLLHAEVSDNNKFKSIIEENEKRINDLKEEIMRERHNATESNNKNESLNNRITVLTTEVKKLEVEADQHEIRHVSEIESLQNTIDKLTIDNKKFKEIATSEIDKANKAEIELAELKGEHKAMISQIAQMEKIISGFAPKPEPKINNQSNKTKANNQNNEK